MRKLSLTEEIIQTTFELLLEGHYNVDVAEAIGISERNYYNWLNRGEEVANLIEEGTKIEEELTEKEALFFQFFQVNKKASTLAKMEALKNIRKAGKRNWQAEAWFLERKYRHQFGRVQMIEDSKDSENKQGLLEKLISGVDAIAEEEEE